MLGRIHVFAAAALCISSYALGATPPSIGSVTGHLNGIVKIDNYLVNGGGTVFDGSVVETGETVNSTADIRLGNNSVITLEAESRGKVYRDHFVLQRGTVTLGFPASFRVEVSGLVVTPSESQSSGIVSIELENTVNVEAKTGNLEVLGLTGRQVALVRPGNPLAFSPVNGDSSTIPATGKAVYTAHANGATATNVASNVMDRGRFEELVQSNPHQSLVVDGIRISPSSTIIEKCLSISINGVSQSLCCKGGPTPEFCCPGKPGDGLCCVSGAPGSMCHMSR